MGFPTDADIDAMPGVTAEQKAVMKANVAHAIAASENSASAQFDASNADRLAGTTKFGLPIPQDTAFAAPPVGPTGGEGAGPFVGGGAFTPPPSVQGPASSLPGPKGISFAQAKGDAGNEKSAPGEPSDPIARAFDRWRNHQADLTESDLSIVNDVMRTRGLAGGSGTGELTKLGQTTSTSSSQRLLTPEAKASLAQEQTLAGQRASERDQLAQAQVANGEAQALQATGKADQLQQYAADRANMQAENANRMEKLQGDVQKAQQGYVKAASEMDPNRYMHQKGWTGALAMALGTFSSVAGKGPNYALQVINQNIDRDIDKQKSDISAKKDQISFTQQIYNEQRQRFSDAVAAKEATKGAMLEVLAAKADATAARMKGTEQAANSRDAASQMRAESQARMTNAYELESKTVSSQSTTQYANTGPGGGAGAGAAGKEPDAAKYVAETQDALKKARAGNGGDSEKEQTLYNEVMGKIPDAAAAALSASRLKKANEDSNPITRAFPETSALFGATSGIHQKATQTQASERNIKALTGAVASPAQTQAQNETVSTGWTASQHNVGVGAMQQGLIDTLGAQMMGLSPQQRAKAFERMSAANMPADMIDAIKNFRGTQSAEESGAELGLTSH